MPYAVRQVCGAGRIRDPNASNLEDLDIGPRRVDLRQALAERSTQIVSARRGVRPAQGHRLNASIDIRQAPRPSRTDRSRATLHLGISRQGAQRKRRSDRGRHPAGVRPFPRRRCRAVAGIDHRDLCLHGAYGDRSALPHLSAHVGERARNPAGDRRRAEGARRCRARAVRVLAAAGGRGLGAGAGPGTCDHLPHGRPHSA
ncbi:hypothetical protein EI171_39190 [Bradyrhizobium sp. LCT2]|nr:hypothetical protein EI171_39190 [Bradyrhizobium sp. LCT2]